MKTSTKYIQQASEGHELELPCGKCCAKTFHRVVCSDGVESSREDQHNFHEWWVDNQIVQCQGCKMFSFRMASGDSQYSLHVRYDGRTRERLLYFKTV